MTELYGTYGNMQQFKEKIIQEEKFKIIKKSYTKF